jgi:hypothetical protein
MCTPENIGDAPCCWRSTCTHRRGCSRSSPRRGGDGAGDLAGLVTVARAAEAEVRLAYVRDLPRPRVDRYDRTVADTDAEMARITSPETVVRFGKPRREAALAAETYAPPDRRALSRRPRGCWPGSAPEAAATAGPAAGPTRADARRPRRPEVRHAGDVARQELLAARRE